MPEPQIIVAPLHSRLNKKYKHFTIVKVACPYCKDIHTHGITDTQSSIHHRGADCGKGAYYVAHTLTEK